MKRARSINDLTRRNIDTIAQIEKAFKTERTLGDAVADAVVTGMGSWTFIILQSALLVCWMAVNVAAWFYQWDPYPFILLNLILSCQAAYASPLILMSQNREAELHERRNRLDLQINLLAEQENTETLRLLRLLCEKSGIELNSDESLSALEQSTSPEELIRELDGAEPGGKVKRNTAGQKRP